MSANVESIEEVKSIFRDVYGTVALPQVLCRDCKFWVRKMQYGDVMGGCSNPKMNANTPGATEWPEDGLWADNNAFMTGPMFSCIHAEQK